MILGTAALLASCGQKARLTDSSSGNGVVHSARIFREGALVKPYEAPGEGGWARRYVDHLHVGTKAAHHFAQERLVEIGSEATPILVEELRAESGNRSSMGYLVSLCAALAACENPQGAEVLIDLLKLNPAPVVRTAAFEALAKLLPEGQELAVLELVAKETEIAPRAAGLQVLAAYGNPESIAYLLEGANAWLNAEQQNSAGEACWKALLLVESPTAALALQSLEPRLAPFPTLQAYGIRIALGERDLADRIKPYLNPELYPSAGTRALALQLLGELGDWESVLSVQNSQVIETELALVALLRRSDAAEAGIGLNVLDTYAESAVDEDVRFNALLGLLERGFSNRLDPFLRLAREFPTGKGSVAALQFLGKDGVADERTAGILIARWPFAQGSHRSSLLKALTRTHSMEAAEFLLQRVLDEQEDPEVRSVSATVLANFGPETISMFEQIWNQSPSLANAKRVVPGVGRYPDEPAARTLILELASAPDIDDWVRRATLEKIPMIFKQDGYQMLVDIAAEESRVEIRQFINGILTEYY